MKMPKFSQESFTQLSTCHIDLQAIFYEVIKSFDCKVIEGYRNEEKQNEAYFHGNTQLQWPNGKHNRSPSMAVDVVPYDPKLVIDWKDTQRFHYFGGYVMGIAQKLKDEGKITHAVRWGGDWDRDTQVKDESFRDLGHFELVL